MRGRKMAEAVRRHQKAQKEERIVADVEQVAGEDSAGPGAGIGKHDADKNQQANLRPTVAQLRGMQQAEYRAGEKNTDGHAEAARGTG